MDRIGISADLTKTNTIEELEDLIFQLKYAIVTIMKKKGKEINPKEIKLEHYNNKVNCFYEIK